ncbi:MAG: glycoside hydrolase family 3 C-terminal domain-containing protein [Rikenellaceae bacterium]|nr:glycoside hydrolase family 3 C-terminal domain-containing protein [Rikenellaceae bacterium]
MSRFRRTGRSPIILSVLSVLFFTAAPAAASSDNIIYKDPEQPVEEHVRDLLGRMTLEEKVGQMCQYVGLEHMCSAAYELPPEEIKKSHSKGFYADFPPEVIERMTKEGIIGSFLHVLDPEEANYLQLLAAQSRLGIPLLIGIDAVHGNSLVEGATVYPTPIGQATSFDPELIREISRQTALEMRATGTHWSFAPNLEVARDARWGRVGETFGEDPYLVGLIGAATIEGFQFSSDDVNKIVAACAKHLVGGSQPVNGINGAPFDVSERTLREVFLPPFREAVRAGVRTMMPAHNEYNGIPCHASRYLMDELARQEWGFDGFFVSDWMDIERMHDYHRTARDNNEAFLKTVAAGMDMHMHGPDFFYGILELVRSGRISEEGIDRSVAMILEMKFDLGLFENPYVDTDAARNILFNADHRATALEAARKGIVLLKNDGLLPLDPGKYRRILVTGPNATDQALLGDWSARQPDGNVVTVWDGMNAYSDRLELSLCEFGWNLRAMDPSQVDRAVELAAQSDLAIVVVGENSMRYHWKEKTCGENSDRYDLSLVGLQQQLVERIHATGTPTVVVLVNGRPLGTEWIADNIPAIIEAWEPGSMGGRAVAEIVMGEVNPSGKLPVTIPRHAGQVQTYYNYRFTSKWFDYATGNSAPLYEFGYGLSYTTYDYSEVEISARSIVPGMEVTASVTVTNTGTMAGEEIVQMYLTQEYASVTRPVKELKGFRRIALSPGESRRVEFTVTPDDMALLDADMLYTIEPGDFIVSIGPSSRDRDLQQARFTVL